MMSSALRPLALAALLTSAAHAQQPAAPAGAAPASPPQKPTTERTVSPVRVDVVIARYQGDKRVSSVPYTLFTTLIDRDRSVAQVRMGAEIPIESDQHAETDPSRGSTPGRPRNYERIGTEIDCVVSSLLDGRHLVEVSVSDRTVYAEDYAQRLIDAGRTPPLRSFRSASKHVLRDGQRTEFTAAGDRVTGEQIRIEIALAVVR